jgi:predicted peptidase
MFYLFTLHPIIWTSRSFSLTFINYRQLALTKFPLTRPVFSQTYQNNAIAVRYDNSVHPGFLCPIFYHLEIRFETRSSSSRCSGRAYSRSSRQVTTIQAYMSRLWTTMASLFKSNYAKSVCLNFSPDTTASQSAIIHHNVLRLCYHCH